MQILEKNFDLICLLRLVNFWRSLMSKNFIVKRNGDFYILFPPSICPYIDNYICF